MKSNKPRNSAAFATAQSEGDLGNRLRAEAKELEAELHSAPIDEWTDDVQRDDYASFDELREMEYSHIDALNNRLRQVNGALERMTTGKYGRCIKCDKRIETRRLLGDPSVSLCFTCQAAVEPVAHFSTL